MTNSDSIQMPLVFLPSSGGAGYRSSVFLSVSFACSPVAAYG